MFAFHAKTFAIAFLVFFFPSRHFFWMDYQKLFNVLSSVIKKACDEDLAHSMDTLKALPVKIFSQVVICDTCDI